MSVTETETTTRGPRLTDEQKRILESLGLPHTGARANKSLDAIRKLDGVELPVWIQPKGKENVPPAIVEAAVPIKVIPIDIGKESVRKAVEKVMPDVSVIAYLGGLLLTNSNV